MTDAEKREKVIFAIENCLTTDSVTECRKTECPVISCRESCLEWILRSALDLLKAQEPRVMTLEEARETLHNSDFIVIENREDIDLFLGMRTSVEWDFSNGAYMEFDDMHDNAKSGDYYVRHYNKDFRFWTSRPSNQQRYSTPWKGDAE